MLFCQKRNVVLRNAGGGGGGGGRGVSKTGEGGVRLQPFSI